MNNCREPGCTSQHYAKEKCRRHYDLTYKKEYYIKNRKTILEKMRQDYLKNPNKFILKAKKGALSKKYFPNMTADEAYLEFNKLVKEQDNVCAICKKSETKIDVQNNTVTSLAVDHCHASKKVRGLLCFCCNTKLGWAEKNLNEILSYLNKGEK